jgi:hypothetical protein
MDNHKRSYSSNDDDDNDDGDFNDMHDNHKSKLIKKTHEKNDDDDDKYNLKLSKHNKIDHEIAIEDRQKKNSRSDNDSSSFNGINNKRLLSLFTSL